MTERFLWCSGELIPPLSKNTTIPEFFTPCLTFAVIPTLSLSCVVVSFVTVVVSSLFFTNRSLSIWASTTRLKLILTISSIFCALFASILVFAFEVRDQHDRNIFEVMGLIFFISAFTSHRLSLHLGYVTDGWLHLSWLLQFASLIPAQFYLINEAVTRSNVFDILLALLGAIKMLCSFVQVVILYYPDNIQQFGDYERLNEKNICQMFAGKLLKKSFSGKVSHDDYWQLDKDDRAASIRRYTTNYRGTNNSLWALVWLLIRCCWVHQTKALLNTSATIFARYMYYYSISSILEIFSGDYPHFLAVFFAVGIVLIDFTKNTALLQLYLHGNLAFYQVRTALIMLIFDKMLRLSSSAQTNTATGVIINHVTVDILRNRKLWGQINEFLYCPAIMIVSITNLTYQVGLHNTLNGLFALIACQLINLILARLSAKFTNAQMRYKDGRLKLINDLLNGVRVLKLYGWESSMQRIVTKVRQSEILEIFKMNIVYAFLETSFDIGPFVALLITLYGYVVVDGERLTPKTAFVTLFLFNLIRFAVYKTPQLMQVVVTAMISLRRINKFLNESEREERQVRPMKEGDEFVVELSEASFSWTDSPEMINLSSITLNIRPGQLVAIVGPVASGKSTFLAAIANELSPLYGDVKIRSSKMAYVQQQAWIQNMTLRDNILFERAFDEDLYEGTLDACSLRDDIQLLPGGDLTEIGEKGINLSGGQRARVSLARAVYQQADFYVLDDPLSAVDSHVGQQIFTNIIAHGAGRITYCGPYSGLSNQSFVSLASQVSSSSSDNEQTTEKETRLLDEEFEKASLIEAESFRHGKVSYGMYAEYVRDFGVILFILFCTSILVGWTTAKMFANVYIANWSSHAINMTKQESLHSLIVYGIFGVAADSFLVVSLLLLGFGCYRASSSFHKKLVASILKAPMSFFDKTPLGRIMNRFSMDMEYLDTSFCHNYGNFFILLGAVIFGFMSVFAAVPWLIPLVIPSIIALVFISRYFNAACAQFRRIASNSMSMVCSSVQDAYTGASSIRVYNAVQRFKDQFAEKLDRTVESNTVEIIANCWVQTRMNAFADIVILSFLLIAIWFTDNGWITLGFLGMIVNSSISIGGLFGDVTETYRDAETEAVCVERLKEYIMLENEPIWKEGAKAQPSHSGVSFKNISLRYREQDDPVLHKVSFSVESGERVGIVGRTGAGKTSLTSLLFRLIEPFEGSIEIGGVDIKKLGSSLRLILTIIPQDPVLFCGSLRSNLDPFGEFEDQHLCEALEKAHLAEFVHSLANGLDYEIADGGNNLSVGQRQLICLARALLRTTRILVMDEATSSVDPETDQLIQQTIRENFKTCTVLTIAHRLNTVIDYDKILVMQAGRVVEFDSPSNLLANQDSLFYEFAKMAKLC